MCQFLSNSLKSLEKVGARYLLPVWAVGVFYAFTTLMRLASVFVAVVAFCLAARSPAVPFADMAAQIEASGHRLSSSVSELLAWAFVFLALPPLLALLYRNTLPTRQRPDPGWPR